MIVQSGSVLTEFAGNAMRHSTSRPILSSGEEDTLLVAKQRCNSNHDRYRKMLGARSVSKQSSTAEAQILEVAIDNIIKDGGHCPNPSQSSAKQLSRQVQSLSQKESPSTKVKDHLSTSVTDQPVAPARHPKTSHVGTEDSSNHDLTQGKNSPASTRIVTKQTLAFIDANEVPHGIVSSRIMRIAASDPGLPPTAFQAVMRTNSRNRQEPNHRPRTTGICTQRPSSIEDPLSRVSQERDIASLASLAETSQTEPVASFPASTQPELTEKPTSIPVTPQRRAPDPPSKSVRAMVARFDHTEQSPTTTPTLDKTIRRRDSTVDSSMHSQVISSYVTNESPVIRSLKSNDSMRSAPANRSGKARPSPLSM